METAGQSGSTGLVGWAAKEAASEGRAVRPGPHGGAQPLGTDLAAPWNSDLSMPDPARAMAALISPRNSRLNVGAAGMAPSQAGAAPSHDEGALEALLRFTSFQSGALLTAQRILANFGSIGSVLAASPTSLAKLLGDCDDVITLLRSVRQTMLLALKEPLSDRPVLKNSAALRNYLHISLAHEEREVVRLLFLDARNTLIADELHSSGTVSHTPVYPREIVRRVIEVNATALIIVHNHPSGDPTPSSDDVTMTKLLANVLSGISVKLQDSVVVGRQGCTSLRAQGLL